MMRYFQSIKLIIVDDNAKIIDAVKNMFKNSIHINLLGCCLDRDKVLPFIEENEIDVILMEVRINKISDFETVKKVKSHNPEIKVIGFSLFDHADFVDRIMSSGADGFLSKYDANKESMEKELFRVIGL